MKVKTAGGSVAEAQLASYNRLRDAGLHDLAHTFMLYHTSLMDVKLSKGDVTVTITDSTVGSVAFDSEVRNINTSVNALTDKGGKTAEFALALKQLTEAATTSNELSEDKKKALLESLEMIGQQAQEPPEHRKTTILKYVFDNLPKAFGVATSLAELWHTVGPTLINFFG